MAEPLKNHFGPAIPKTISGMIAAVFRDFDSTSFVKDVLDGYEALELLPRGWKIARALRPYLPRHFPDAVNILTASLGPKLERTEDHGMTPFLYLPHACFVAEYGLDHFEESMAAQYEITQRFTAEFSIRPFIEKYPDATLARLRIWATDPSPHVRRLVSEGTRPRLPWAPRLRAFEKDPRPVLALLELLKDDPELYVRRSVANHLNDLGKDNPDLLIQTATRWLKGASDERRWVVNHALRSAVKRAEAGALGVLGFGSDAKVKIHNATVKPQRVAIGGAVEIAFELKNTGTTIQRVLVDFRIHFVKANGATSAKVFKLKTVEVAPKETVRLSKKVSLREMTTRKHYPGVHKVEAMLNGRV
ncbi:MAG: DNA alkylation repair protein, partial [Burkholderiales bacterium]